MWIHIQIIIYVLSVMFLPYLLAGGILKFAIPSVKSNRIAILATLFVVYLDQEYHLCGNILQLQNGIENSFDRLVELEKAGLNFYAMFFISYIPFLIGILIIPFCFARSGVWIVDKLKKGKNSQPKDALNSDTAGAESEQVI